MVLTPGHLEMIRKSAEKVKYGKIIIMIDHDRKYIDIITEQRERVENGPLTENENRRII
jgi:hypothetical protein